MCTVLTYAIAEYCNCKVSKVHKAFLFLQILIICALAQLSMNDVLPEKARHMLSSVLCGFVISSLVECFSAFGEEHGN